VERERKDVERLANEIEQLRASKAKAENTAQALRVEYDNLIAQLERCSRSLKSVEMRVEELNHGILEGTRLLAEATHKKKEAESRLKSLTGETSASFKSEAGRLLDLENRYAQLLHEVNQMRQVDADTRSRFDSIVTTIEAHRNTISHLLLQREDLAERLKNTQQTIQDLRTTEEEIRKRIDALEQQRRGTWDDLSAVKEERTKVLSELEQIELDKKQLFKALDPINENIRELNGRVAQLETEKRFLQDQLCATGVERAVEPTRTDLKDLEEALNRLKRERDSIGQVNALAVKQYEEVYANYSQLSARINEVEKEKLAILNFMNELERRKLEAFMKGFNQVNRAFQEIFAQITAGGDGRLVLEDEADPFKGGVDIFLQFPGKPGATIRSASGGERSVGTVTFLLALQAIHPMPFYFFDEIDAHMDVLNTKRLADLLREKSRGSQFVVISLKDTTIAKADRVFGVYIQDAVSQVVSLPMVEAR